MVGTRAQTIMVLPTTVLVQSVDHFQEERWPRRLSLLPCRPYRDWLRPRCPSSPPPQGSVETGAGCSRQSREFEERFLLDIVDHAQAGF